jgi:hypothetical protein
VNKRLQERVAAGWFLNEYAASVRADATAAAIP